MPYAWDEPTALEKLCIQPASTAKSKEFDFDSFGPRGKLYYDSYFYIAAVATFPDDMRWLCVSLCAFVALGGGAAADLALLNCMCVCACVCTFMAGCCEESLGFA